MVCNFPKSTRVVQHIRAAHTVRGHFRGARWIPAHNRDGSIVCEHCRS